MTDYNMRIRYQSTRLTAAAALLAVAMSSSPATAYETKHAESGATIRWHEDTVGWVLDPTLSYLPPSEVEAAVVQGFEAWNDLSGVALVLRYDGWALGEPAGYSGEDNRNVVRFEEEINEYDLVAVTLQLYGRSTGRLIDGDIIVNAYGFPFSASGEMGAYDIQSVIAHEAGHFIGLAHQEHDELATMYPTATRGEIIKRDLTYDDIAGARFLYPDLAELAQGDPVPASDTTNDNDFVVHNDPVPASDTTNDNDFVVQNDPVSIGATGCSQSGASAVSLPAICLLLLAALAHRRFGPA